MARKQSEFLQIFRKAFENRFNVAPDWSGGQILTNKACFSGLDHYRRERRIRSNEGIELGDLRTSFQQWTVIVEYESSAMVVQNLLKYWPYLRGELSCAPREPILLCHFSEWSSWGSYRDLWSWLRSQIAADQSVEVPFATEQFDHGGQDQLLLERGITCALDFIADRIESARVEKLETV